MQRFPVFPRCCVHATLTLSTSPPVSMLRSHFSMSPLSPYCAHTFHVSPYVHATVALIFFITIPCGETTNRPVQAAICTVVQPLFRSNRKIKKWCRTKQIHSVLCQSSHGTFSSLKKRFASFGFSRYSTNHNRSLWKLEVPPPGLLKKTIHTGLEYVKLHSIVLQRTVHQGHSWWRWTNLDRKFKVPMSVLSTGMRFADDLI